MEIIDIFVLIKQKNIFIIIFIPDVKQERTHNALMNGVETFQTSTLKRTNTKEKIVLPNAQGKLCGFERKGFPNKLY